MKMFIQKYLITFCLILLVYALVYSLNIGEISKASPIFYLVLGVICVEFADYIIRSKKSKAKVYTPPELSVQELPVEEMSMKVREDLSELVVTLDSIHTGVWPKTVVFGHNTYEFEEQLCCVHDTSNALYRRVYED